MNPLAAETAARVARLRERKPRVHCITNTVVQAFTANLLLAAGAIPSMTVSPEEIGDFVARADALLINLGTFDRERREAIEIAIEVAIDEDIPWVLDPVLIDRSDLRAKYARTLAGREPRVIRGNEAELAMLVDDENNPDALARFALSGLTVLAQSGATDLVTDGTRRTGISNGHAWMAQVTGVGCAESALIAALLAIEDEPYGAAVGGLLALNIAGEVAAERASGPGAFAVNLIDALHGLDPATIERRARIS